LVLVEQITDVDSAFEKAANYQKKNEGPTDELTGGEFDLRGCLLCARHESYSFATLYILPALSAVSGRWSKKILCINENPLLSYDKRGEGNAYASIDRMPARRLRSFRAVMMPVATRARAAPATAPAGLFAAAMNLVMERTFLFRA
jgi:hypothetical protein